MTPDRQVLEDCRILVVEDEYLLAEELRVELTEAGAEVVGPVPTVERALRLLEDERDVHGAILDVNLGGEPVFSLADTLIGRGVPVVFATGYDISALPSRFADVPCCGKPIDRSRIALAMRSAMAM